MGGVSERGMERARHGEGDAWREREMKQSLKSSRQTDRATQQKYRHKQMGGGQRASQRQLRFGAVLRCFVAVQNGPDVVCLPAADTAVCSNFLPSPLVSALSNTLTLSPTLLSSALFSLPLLYSPRLSRCLCSFLKFRGDAGLTAGKFLMAPSLRRSCESFAPLWTRVD